jgi:ABC-type lipoprotein release transport system permease subunit
MIVSNLARLIGQNLRRNRKNLAFSSIGIVVGISSFVFFIALGSGIKRVVSTEIFPLDANRVEVVPRTAQFGSLSGGKSIDDQSLAQFRALPGVTEVYPRIKLQFLASASVDGRNISPTAMALLARVPGIDPSKVRAVRDVRMWLEIMGTGIDPRLVEQDATAGAFADVPEGEPIPVLLSSRMVEIYNASFAEARNLPKIDPRILPFIPPLPLTLNHSFISRQISGQPVQTSMKVVGLSRHAILGGITMPLETARRYNQRFVGGQAASTYDAAILQVGNSAQLGPVQEQIRSLGFDIDLRERRMAESVGLIITLVTLGFTLISLIIVGIAAVNIAHTFFMIIYERKRELGLLRALGATRADVRAIILGEATFIGVLAGGLGLGFGIAACLAADLLMGGVLPDFPFKPESFFAYPLWLFAGGIGFAVVFCWLGAIFPAQRAAKLDPASTLTGR